MHKHQKTLAEFLMFDNCVNKFFEIEKFKEGTTFNEIF